MERDKMSEEDKEFIKSLKTQCKGAREIFKDTCCQLPISYIEKIIDIVDKQLNEIEELQEDKKVLVDNYSKVLSSFISKDKIRDKIKELKEEGTKQYWTENVVKMLRELLEE